MKSSPVAWCVVLAIAAVCSCGSGDDPAATSKTVNPPPPSTPNYSGTYVVLAPCGTYGCSTLTFGGFPSECKITVTSSGDFIVRADVNGTERVYADGGFNWDTKTGQGYGYRWEEVITILDGLKCYQYFTLGAVLTFSDEDHFSGSLSYHKVAGHRSDSRCPDSCEGKCYVSGTRVQ